MTAVFHFPSEFLRLRIQFEGDLFAVADTACFLLSDMARAITGEIIHVDGGFHAMATSLRTP